MMSDSGNLVDTWELPGAAGGAAAVEAADTGAAAAADGAVGPSVMRNIIRSKGFVWVANQVC